MSTLKFSTFISTTKKNQSFTEFCFWASNLHPLSFDWWLKALIGKYWRKRIEDEIVFQDNRFVLFVDYVRTIVRSNFCFFKKENTFSEAFSGIEIASLFSAAAVAKMKQKMFLSVNTFSFFRSLEMEETIFFRIT